ncbi:synapsin-1 [Reticulomyxa filosa]|uniref:Synapsin-1 n=1 Tax=Reticulomyxa filosa TaxID=46433 RepID=X6M1G8_RETFI|nr:synapsin-1 [Reticulomyxa filosa]|eukprot:ETO07431.1 synapsin-1 [Reticulomyxa filosa]
MKGQCDLRIQKIGTHYRVFKRISMSGNWKTNTGTAHIEDLELLPRYKFWADICGQSFGGMDIVTVDVLVAAQDGKEYILEFNGTASGFGKDEEDNLILREFTIHKMNEYFVDYKGPSIDSFVPVPEEMKLEEEHEKSKHATDNNVTTVNENITNESSQQISQDTKLQVFNLCFLDAIIYFLTSGPSPTSNTQPNKYETKRNKKVSHFDPNWCVKKYVNCVPIAHKCDALKKHKKQKNKKKQKKPKSAKNCPITDP